MKVKGQLTSWLLLTVLMLTVIAMLLVIAGLIGKLSCSSDKKSKERFFPVPAVCENCWENFSSYTDHPSKCYSCEQDIIRRQGEEWAWRGQKTKSFDAERAMILRTGQPEAAYDAHPIRYY